MNKATMTKMLALAHHMHDKLDGLCQRLDTLEADPVPVRVKKLAKILPFVRP